MPEPPASNSARHDLYPPWHTKRRPLSTSLANMIPTEIFERILDHLYDDVRTLKACTLVCWSWFTRSRYHLFADVQLDSPRIDEFLQCFDANTLRAVRGLTACVPREFQFQLDRTPSSSSSSQPEDPFVKVSILLPNIEFLRLATFPPPTRLPSWLANYQNTLTHLVIQNTVFPTMSSFLTAISGLRVLRHLGVEFVCWMTQDFPSPEEFPVSEVLESLSFDLDRAGVKIVQWILGRHAPPPVTRVYLHAYDPEVTEEVVVVYKNLAKSLECVNVTQDVLKSISLSSFPALRHIIFSDIFVFQGRFECAQQLKAHISNISSTHLESLVFRIAIDDLGNLQNVDWRGIVRLLDEPRFRGLKRIDFSLGLFSRQAKHVILQYFLRSWLRKRIYFTGFDVLRERVLHNWP